MMGQAIETGAAAEDGGELRASLENPSVSLSSAAAWASVFSSWSAGAAGVIVSRETALGVPAVWAAVNFISATIASLPLDLYAREGSNRRIAAGNPLHAILHDAVNDEKTSFEWRKQAMQNVLLGGRAFTFIERNVAGRIINLWPLDPLGMRVERREGRTRYHYSEGGRWRLYEAREIIDIPWMVGGDGLAHYDPVERLRNAVGLAIAMEKYAAHFFSNGGIPPLQLVGPLESPGAVRRAAIDIMEAINAAKAEGRSILPMPLMHELKPIGIEPERGQLVEGRRFQLEEIARIYQLPPVFLQDLTKATLSNSEQQDLHFVKHTLTQWLKQWEQQLNLKLFGRQRGLFVEFNVDGLLRGDFAARINGYATGIQNAIYTPDEVRGMENWPAMGGDAARLHIQGATVPLGQQLQRGAASSTQTGADND